MQYVTNDDLRDKVRTMLDGKTQQQLADQLKCSQSMLSQFLKGERDASDAMIRALGFVPVAHYPEAKNKARKK
jgi:transcriptional regulator with XRE-family HTH domain